MSNKGTAINMIWGNKGQKSPFPRPMARRAAPISVSITLGQASANAVKATAGGAGLLVAPPV